MKICLSYAILIFAASFYILYNVLGIIVLFFLRSILYFFPRLKEEATLFIKRKWLDLTATLIGFYFHQPIYIAYNKEILKTRRSIILSNHLTNYDWLFLMLVLRDLKKYDELRIILKESLANIPIFGYGMKCFKFIFLKRNWTEDKEKLQKGIGNLKEKLEYNVLIFPEGTFIDSESHVKSKDFSEELQYKIKDQVFNPEYTLIPRVKGLNLLYNELKDKCDNIIDTTLMFLPFHQYPSEKFTIRELIQRNLKDIQVFIILDSIGLQFNEERWVYNQFYLKNKTIEKFQENVEEFQKVDTLEKLAHNLFYITNKNYHYKKIELWSKTSYFLIFIYLILSLIINYYLFRNIIKI